MISLHGLTKEFPGGVRAVDALDLEIADGEFFALLGPSGCGKTTLLRTIAGLETPTSGNIVIGGTDVTALPPGRRDVAMVFQDYALSPHMDVMADRIAVMSAGRITQVGTPSQVFQRPANTFVASFIGSTPMNLLPGVAKDGALRVAGAVLPMAPGVAEGEEIVYGLRPEYMDLSASPRQDAFAGHVSVVENLGTSYLVTLEVASDAGDLLVQAVVPEDAEPTRGGPAWAVPRHDRALVYRDGELVVP
ncbi:ABC transporter ATP-binding protein [Sphaerisporangium sp. NPDC088356]|uniref:ABC transporter ATP-binding protein n=1 Tax=Sphaerisporangium sp. NPDC088356 TaxID=3154871 RepID=UPI0034326301